MKDIISKRLDRVQPSLIRKFLDHSNVLRNEGKDVISLTTGEPDFDTPQKIKEAIKEAIDLNFTHYGDTKGYLPLRKEIVKKIKRETGVEYNPDDEVLITAGGSQAIHHMILATIDDGDEVIIFTPAFVSYDNMVEIAKGKIVYIPLKREDNFQIDLKVLEEKITDKTKLVIINSPNNPTGIVTTKEVMEGFCQLMVKYDLLVFSDEIYNCITYNGIESYPVISFPGMRERTVYMNGFSKAYAMTGFRVGYVAGPSQYINALALIHQYTIACLPTFTLVGLAKSMNDSEVLKESQDMVEVFDQRRIIVKNTLDSIESLSYVLPTGAFYYYIDVSKTKINGYEFCERFLNEWFVALVPGITFGKEFGSYIRLSYALDTEKLKVAMERLKGFVEVLVQE
jgi:Aspartate/tyrosine/aromatic aminotransferase